MFGNNSVLLIALCIVVVLIIVGEPKHGDLDKSLYRSCFLSGKAENGILVHFLMRQACHELLMKTFLGIKLLARKVQNVISAQNGETTLLRWNDQILLDSTSWRRRDRSKG